VVAGVEGAIDIGAGAVHSCAVIAGGSVSCWGEGLFGALGADGVGGPDAQTITGVSGAVEVRSGGYASCVRTETDDVWCWGGDTLAGAIPAQIDGVDDVVRFGRRNSHACALQKNGILRCWGDNEVGQLGNGEQSMMEWEAVTVTGLAASVVEVAAGWRHTCVLYADGTVACWGLNEEGQLGDGTFDDRVAPTLVDGVDDVVSITCGHATTCAVRRDGAVYCWGWNGASQLGDGTHDSSATPVLISGVKDVVQVAVGHAHVCALTARGETYCWGVNTSKQLGSWDVGIESAVPVLVSLE